MWKHEQLISAGTFSPMGEREGGVGRIRLKGWDAPLLTTCNLPSFTRKTAILERKLFTFIRETNIESSGCIPAPRKQCLVVFKLAIGNPKYCNIINRQKIDTKLFTNNSIMIQHIFKD